jgi:hypothetical protein
MWWYWREKKHYVFEINITKAQLPIQFCIANYFHFELVKSFHTTPNITRNYTSLFSAVSVSGGNPIAVRITRLQSEFLMLPRTDAVSYSQKFCSSKDIQLRSHYDIHVCWSHPRGCLFLIFLFSATKSAFPKQTISFNIAQPKLFSICCECQVLTWSTVQLTVAAYFGTSHSDTVSRFQIVKRLI